MSNAECQEDELLSLQSIFEEKEFSVDGMDPPSGRIVVEVNLPDGFYVIAMQLAQSDTVSQEEVFQVDHLPPINLFFQFSNSYPLDTCPSFLLSCNWLSLEQLSLLCKQLEYIWEMNTDVILYTWIQFLRDEALDFLNISQCLNISELLTFKIKDNFRRIQNDTTNNSACDADTSLSAQINYVVPSVSGGDKAIDLRAFNDLPDGKLIIQILKDYDEYKKECIFDTSIQECDVCFQQKLGSEFIKFKTCKHYFCKDCVKEYFEGLIKDGNVTSLKCLIGECGSQLDQSTIKVLVGPDLYERYESLLLSIALQGMSDIAYCPRRECQCPCIIDTCGRIGTCSACQFVFCPFCKMTYHGVNPCNSKSAQRKKLFEEYINANSSVKKEMEEFHGKRVLRSLVDDILSERWKSSNSKSCPHCSSSIEKTDGCHKMTCFR